MATFTVNLHKSYPIYIGAGQLAVTLPNLSSWVGNARPVLVVDATVASLYKDTLAQVFAPLEPLILTVPAGEQNKSRESKAYLEDAMLQAGCNRDTVIIALGGGMVCDLAGFTAATYCRGIPVVLVPTTLLAMVDASIGGKTAINTSLGKNMIGAFHQPSLVIMDTTFLHTLSASEINNGVAEMLKHALLADASQTIELQQRHTDSTAPHWLLADMPWLEDILLRNVCVKKYFVEADERDTGTRQLLNLGHTVGHAAEQLSGYALSHGHAVAIGMLVEGYIAYLSGFLSQEQFAHLADLLALCGFPLFTPHLCDVATALATMRLDKKNKGQAIYCVMLQNEGQPVTMPIPIQVVEQALLWYNAQIVA